MKSRLAPFNSLRNQISIVFILVMIIVLGIVSILTFNLVGVMLKTNAEKQIQQTAVQANGRFDTLYQQIDMLTNQVVTNETVQTLMQNIMNGEELEEVELQQRQSLLKVVNTFPAYSKGIHSFELYTADKIRLFPMDKKKLTARIEPSWIEKANSAKGQLVWIGDDLKYPDSFLAIRRVSIMNQSFSGGGYLLVRVERSYLQFLEVDGESQGNETHILLDSMDNPISDSYEGDSKKLINEYRRTISVNKKDFLIIKHTSEITGWTLFILTPVDELTRGFTSLKIAILISGIIGFLIFIFSSIFISTMITRPIFNLTKAMKHATEGELVTNPDTSSTLEIMELNQTYNQMVENTNYLIQVVYEKEIMRSRTELEALQAQINPHFLYNTLNAFYWSLIEKEEEELAENVVAMSDLFRYTISHPKKDDWVTVGEELEQIERYMKLMKMRFGDRLIWRITAPEDSLKIEIPKLIIQPLVENAILHGIGNQLGTGTVFVKLERFPNNIRISVIDDGPGMSKQTVESIQESIEGITSSVKKNGMALVNVNKRLRLYYNDDPEAGLSITSQLGQGTCVSFRIPIKRGFYDG
ncbi:sensor histidine kinase [Peribacillus sp. FSL H8-0477]|uniref:sensor histidine kinase n=1 Tax=Peribacillus sp. FSL H8-0477 TaxID=2921388 RepID=UPI0030F5277E